MAARYITGTMLVYSVATNAAYSSVSNYFQAAVPSYKAPAMYLRPPSYQASSYSSDNVSDSYGTETPDTDTPYTDTETPETDYGTTTEAPDSPDDSYPTPAPSYDSGTSDPCSAGLGPLGEVYYSSGGYIRSFNAATRKWTYLDDSAYLMASTYLYTIPGYEFTSTLSDGYGAQTIQWTLGYDNVLTASYPDGLSYEWPCSCQCDDGSYSGGGPTPTPTPTPAPAPAPTPAPAIDCTLDGAVFPSGQYYVNSAKERCHCIGGEFLCCRVRKEVTTVMTDTEREQYTAAVLAARNTADFQNLVNLHASIFSGGIHSTDHFLPWHRWYILQMENLLRSQSTAGASTLTVPFWNWALSAVDPTNNFPFGAGNMWFSGDGDASNGNCVSSGRFSGYTKTNGACLQRNFNGASVAGLLDLDDVMSDYSHGQFSGLSDHLEHGAGMHDAVHCAVHGTMCTSEASNDPVFFLHHAHIDKIWNDWQRQSALHNSAGSNGAFMPGTQSSATPNDFLYSTQQGSSNPVCVEYADSADASYLGELVSSIPQQARNSIPRVLIPAADVQWLEQQNLAQSEIARIKAKEAADQEGKNTVNKQQYLASKSSGGFEALVGIEVGDYVRAASTKTKTVSAYTAAAAQAHGETEGAYSAGDVQALGRYTTAAAFDLDTFTRRVSEADFDRTEPPKDTKAYVTEAQAETLFEEASTVQGSLLKVQHDLLLEPTNLAKIKIAYGIVDTPKYKNAGEGKCRKENGDEPLFTYISSKAGEECQKECDIRDDCYGYSSSASNCLLWLEGNLIAGGQANSWGGADCFVKNLS